MSERKISYLNRTYEDYVKALKEQISTDYPDIANDFDDSSIGTWLIELVASVSDNLSYHIDKAYNETNIDSAQESSSVYALARSNGFKVPGPKPSIVPVTFSCTLPAYSGTPNNSSTIGEPLWTYAPIVKKGTRVRANNGQYFEVTEDFDFSEQYNSAGYSDRKVTPTITTGGRTIYKIEKEVTVYAGESVVHKTILQANKITPFMEYIIPDSNVMCVDSIIFKEGTNYTSSPTMNEFNMQTEYLSSDDAYGKVDTYRFFEVDSLLEQYRWGDDISNLKDGNQDTAKSKTYVYGQYDDSTGKQISTTSVTKGAWIPLTQKFITEFTDNGYLKIIFGSGEQANQTVDSGINDFTQNQMTKMIRNNFLGKLPPNGMTMFILYRKGGGAASNVAAHTINTISYLSCGHQCVSDFNDSYFSTIKNTIQVDNAYPSVSGKDAPTTDEIKAMIKYNSAAQERCITIKDYENRVNMIPPRYGCPFRSKAIEENNKVMLYILGVDNNGYLTDVLPRLLIDNLQDYLGNYKAINDYVEIKPGRIVNLSFEADIYVDKNYNAGDVISNVIDVIYDYMDINKHELGEDIYVGDIEKEVSKVDGVLNLIDLRVYNEYGNNYSQTITSQETKTDEDNETTDELEIDLDASDYILNSESDEMFQVKYKESDIRVRWKSR